MNYKPIFTRYSVIFNLEKPIFGSRYGIWDKWLKLAGKRHIVINTKFGTTTFKNAEEYIKKAERNERFYKNPDDPMVFYVLDFLPEIKAREARKKKERLSSAKKQTTPRENDYNDFHGYSSEVSYDDYLSSRLKLAKISRKVLGLCR